MDQETLRRVKYIGPAVVALLLVGVAAGVVLFSGPLPAWIIERLSTVLPSSATVIQLLLVVVLVGTGLYYVRSPADTRDHAGGLVDHDTPPESARNAPQLAGDSFGSDVDDALRAVRLKDVDYETTDPHHTLFTTAQDAIVFIEGCSTAEAADIIEAGTWTTDQIAQGFLSESVEYPASYQLLRWAKPGEGYELAIERTTAAIEQLVTDGHRPPAATDSETASADSSVGLGSWLDSLLESTDQAAGPSQPHSQPRETPPDEQLHSQPTPEPSGSER